VNIAVHFIRARSNLILNCSKGFPIYLLFNGKEEGQDIGEREREGRVVRTV